MFLIGFWRKANSFPVCFGARNNHFGRFYTPSGGRLAAVKLVHLFGYVSCHTASSTNWSFWGCGFLSGYVNMVITTSGNRILLPPNQFMQNRYKAGKWSRIHGYGPFSPQLIMTRFYPFWVRKGEELRVWYGEDLMNWTEGDNGGAVCCDVYARYV